MNVHACAHMCVCVCVWFKWRCCSSAGIWLSASVRASARLRTQVYLRLRMLLAHFGIVADVTAAGVRHTFKHTAALLRSSASLRIPFASLFHSCFVSFKANNIATRIHLFHLPFPPWLLQFSKYMHASSLSASLASCAACTTASVCMFICWKTYWLQQLYTLPHLDMNVCVYVLILVFSQYSLLYGRSIC